jgi:hypothetical protein
MRPPASKRKTGWCCTLQGTSVCFASQLKNFKRWNY